jgi:hypothetical protein
MVRTCRILTSEKRERFLACRMHEISIAMQHVSESLQHGGLQAMICSLKTKGCFPDALLAGDLSVLFLTPHSTELKLCRAN